MNRFTIFLLLMVIAASSFSQQTSNPQSLTKEDYFKKSAHQKTAAWILLGGGAAFTTVGLAIGSNRVIYEIGASFDGKHDGGFTTGAVFFYTGIASMLGSIPLFIAASKNGRKARSMTASFKMENRLFLQQASISQARYPAISIKIGL